MFFISESLCSGDSLKAVALPEEDFMDVAFDHFGLGDRGRTGHGRQLGFLGLQGVDGARARVLRGLLRVVDARPVVLCNGGKRLILDDIEYDR